MPRPNPRRSIRQEGHLARRIAFEREQRNMTFEGLAHRMGEAGCPIQPSAIYKIETEAPGRPRRRITVEELVAFAEVFAVPVQDLLQPPELAREREISAALAEWRDLAAVVGNAEIEMRGVEARLSTLLTAQPEAESIVREYLADMRVEPENIELFMNIVEKAR